MIYSIFGRNIIAKTIIPKTAYRPLMSRQTFIRAVCTPIRIYAKIVKRPLKIIKRA